MLFDNIARTDEHGRRPRETMWGFLNRCARPGFCQIRRLLETWFAAYPEAEQKRLHARLKSRSPHQFHAAFFELYLFSLLKAMDFCVKIPESVSEGQKIEDFRAHRGGRLKVRVEARFIGPEAEHYRQDRYMEELEWVLSQVNCPELWFTFTVRGKFERAPRVAKMARKFQDWLCASAATIKAELAQRRPALARTCFTVREAGVTLHAYPLCPKSPERESMSPVGSWIGPSRWMGTHKKLRNGLRSKATRYGTMSDPYIVGVCVYEDCDYIDLNDALFGDEIVTFEVGPDVVSSEARMSRKRNGFWLGPRGPQNTRVSAMLFVSQLAPWTVADREAVLYHNPWAQHPICPAALPLPQMIPDRKSGKYKRRDGLPVRELLGLPSGWPQIAAQ